MSQTNGNADSPLSDVTPDGKRNVKRYATNASVAIPMDVFEKMYPNPQNIVKGDLRKTFGNATPLALMGFLIASTPLGCALLGWRGARGGGAATIGVFYFFGGLLQIIGSIMELIIGNTFAFVVFGSYGAFWLALGATLQPTYNAEGAYTEGLTGAAKAAGGAEFSSSFAFYILFVGLLTFMYLICPFRVNIVFVIIFLFLDIALFLLGSAYWLLVEGKAARGHKTEAAGTCVFVFCMFGWYLLFAQLLQALDFPCQLPVGDLSTRIKGASDKRAAMERDA